MSDAVSPASRRPVEPKSKTSQPVKSNSKPAKMSRSQKSKSTTFQNNLGLKNKKNAENTKQSSKTRKAEAPQKSLAGQTAKEIKQDNSVTAKKKGTQKVSAESKVTTGKTDASAPNPDRGTNNTSSTGNTLSPRDQEVLGVRGATGALALAQQELNQLLVAVDNSNLPEDATDAPALKPNREKNSPSTRNEFNPVTIPATVSETDINSGSSAVIFPGTSPNTPTVPIQTAQAEVTPGSTIPATNTFPGNVFNPVTIPAKVPETDINSGSSTFIFPGTSPNTPTVPVQTAQAAVTPGSTIPATNTFPGNVFNPVTIPATVPETDVNSGSSTVIFPGTSPNTPTVPVQTAQAAVIPGSTIPATNTFPGNVFNPVTIPATVPETDVNSGSSTFIFPDTPPDTLTTPAATTPAATTPAATTPAATTPAATTPAATTPAATTPAATTPAATTPAATTPAATTPAAMPENNPFNAGNAQGPLTPEQNRDVLRIRTLVPPDPENIDSFIDTVIARGYAENREEAINLFRNSQSIYDTGLVNHLREVGDEQFIEEALESGLFTTRQEAENYLIHIGHTDYFVRNTLGLDERQTFTYPDDNFKFTINKGFESDNPRKIRGSTQFRELLRLRARDGDDAAFIDTLLSTGTRERPTTRVQAEAILQHSKELYDRPLHQHLELRGKENFVQDLLTADIFQNTDDIRKYIDYLERTYGLVR